LFSDATKFSNYLQLCKIEWMNGRNKAVKVIRVGLNCLELFPRWCDSVAPTLLCKRKNYLRQELITGTSLPVLNTPIYGQVIS
jgi:hypothetical protein